MSTSSRAIPTSPAEFLAWENRQRARAELVDGEAAVPAGNLVRSRFNTDSVQPIRATHKHPKVRGWLEGHERWTFRYVPNFGSWVNEVETFFSAMIRCGISRVF